LSLVTPFALLHNSFAMHTAAQMSMPDDTPRRGLRPGQIHSGSFRKGDDPRRAGGLKIYDGMTLAQMARQHGPACLQFLRRAMDDEAVPWKDRIRASEIILDRGFGKAVATVEVRDARPIESLSRQELMLIASGAMPPLPITIDGEVVEASSSQEPVEQAVSPTADEATP
jgi:hypothetical protein